MYFRAWNTAIGDMGYALSRLEIDPNFSDCESSPVGEDNDSPQPSSDNNLDHKRLKQVLPRRQEFPVSPVKMLAGREGNYSGSLFVAAFQVSLFGFLSL